MEIKVKSIGIVKNKEKSHFGGWHKVVTDLIMKQFLLITTIFLSVTILSSASLIYGQESSHTIREEQEGRQIWERLNKNELTCDQLSDVQLASLGEFFMGEMMGKSHDSMNQMMIEMMGEEGEEQAHMVMGKRMSGCETNVVGGGGKNMMGQWGPSAGSGWMMNWGWFGAWGSIFWVIILIDLILLGVWLWKQIQHK